jgi:hypothetical protein
MNKLFTMLFLTILPMLPAPACAAELPDGWRIVQISAPDRAAVARSPEGELRLVREGDRLGEQISVAGFDGDRLLLETPGEWGRARLLVSVVDGRQRISRLERQPLRKAEVAGASAQIVTVSKAVEQ